MDITEVCEQVRWGVYGVQGEQTIYCNGFTLVFGKYRQGYCKIRVYHPSGEQVYEHTNQFSDIRDPDFWGDLSDLKRRFLENK